MFRVERTMMGGFWTLASLPKQPWNLEGKQRRQKRTQAFSTARRQRKPHHLNYLRMRWLAPPCRTFCDPMDCSPPGSSVHGILQARILEWVAMPSSRGSSQARDWTQVSCTAGGLFTIWTTREAHKLPEGRERQQQVPVMRTCLVVQWWRTHLPM